MVAEGAYQPYRALCAGQPVKPGYAAVALNGLKLRNSLQNGAHGQIRFPVKWVSMANGHELYEAHLIGLLLGKLYKAGYLAVVKAAYRTMAHELGHAYHARCLDGIPLLLRDAPTPICETASLMNETIFLQKSLEQMKPAQRFALLESDLQESTQTLLDIYSRFLFEKEAFAARRDHALLADELCAMMTSAQRRVYADALDPARMHPYMWMCKVHYYIPEFHYYNYPYIFGLLFSKGLYARYLDAPRGFDARYRALLAGTCSGSLEQIAAEAGIEIGTRQFWDDALRMVVRDVDEWLRLAENQTAWQ